MKQGVFMGFLNGRNCHKLRRRGVEGVDLFLLSRGKRGAVTTDVTLFMSCRCLPQ
jgi:hypothetical protein